nr:uncharacterized protein LOC115254286 [Aedes albopictus]
MIKTRKSKCQPNKNNSCQLLSRRDGWKLAGRPFSHSTSRVSPRCTLGPTQIQRGQRNCPLLRPQTVVPEVISKAAQPQNIRKKGIVGARADGRNHPENRGERRIKLGKSRGTSRTTTICFALRSATREPQKSSALVAVENRCEPISFGQPQ